MLIDDHRCQQTYTRWIQQWQAQDALASNVLLDGKQLSDQLDTQRQTLCDITTHPTICATSNPTAQQQTTTSFNNLSVITGAINAAIYGIIDEYLVDDTNANRLQQLQQSFQANKASFANKLATRFIAVLPKEADRKQLFHWLEKMGVYEDLSG